MNIKRMLQINNAAVDAVSIPPKLRDRAGGSIMVVMKQLGYENKYAVAKNRYEVDEQARLFVESFEKKDGEAFIKEILDKLDKEKAEAKAAEVKAEAEAEKAKD